jgi:hypothetical protein
MEDVVWLMENAKLRQRRYLVLLIQQRVYSAEEVRDAIRANVHDFGRQMRDKGAVVMPYEEQVATTFAEVTAKPWPEALRDRMDATKYPFLVIIDRDFAAFDPREHRAAVVWFEDYAEAPDTIWQVFDTITAAVTGADDLFDALAEVERAARAEARAEMVDRYVDARIPLIPGIVSLKANALIRGLLRRT